MLHRAAEDVPVAPAAPAPTVAPDTAEAVAAAAAAAAETAAEEVDAATTATAPPAAPPATTAPAAPTAPRLGSPEIQEQVARFNERSTRRWRSPWQVVEDAPLLLRRLWADLRRGDTRVFSELLRRGVQLQFLGVVLYILIPVRLIVELLAGGGWGCSLPVVGGVFLWVCATPLFLVQFAPVRAVLACLRLILAFVIPTLVHTSIHLCPTIGPCRVAW